MDQGASFFLLAEGLFLIANHPEIELLVPKVGGISEKYRE